jgi:hypothetical protein
MGASEEHAERIAVLETEVRHIKDSLEGIQATLEELKPIVWKAAGAATALLALIQIITKGLP